MDVSLWVRFTATERRERGAAHRVLIEPSLDDPCTALCVIDRAPKPRADEHHGSSAAGGRNQGIVRAEHPSRHQPPEIPTCPAKRFDTAKTHSRRHPSGTPAMRMPSHCRSRPAR